MKPYRRMPKWLFYVASVTWGFVMTFIGALAALVLIIAGKKPQRNMYGWLFEVGKHWGGVSLGPVAIVAEDASPHTRKHEFGHALQNCYLGPYMIVISIASAIRYWYREYMYKVNKGNQLSHYDSIWFEGTATYLGETYFNIE